LAASDSLPDSTSDSLSDSLSKNALGCRRLLLSRRGEFDVCLAVVLRALLLGACGLGWRDRAHGGIEGLGAGFQETCGTAWARAHRLMQAALAGVRTGELITQRLMEALRWDSNASDRLAAGLGTRKTAVCTWSPCQIVRTACSLPVPALCDRPDVFLLRRTWC
jgi:hypothetical protein